MLRWGILATLVAGMLTPGAEAQTSNGPSISEWRPNELDPQDQNTRDPFAKTSPETWFQPTDFAVIAPPGTEVDHELVELTIDTAGKPITCKATSFGPFILDVRGSATDSTARICPVVVKRGLFGPALDQNGRKISALLRLRLEIRGRDPSGALYLELPSSPGSGWWGRLQKQPQLLNADVVAPVKAGPSGFPQILVGVSANGNVAYCKIDKTSGDDLIDAEACRLIRAKAKFDPAIAVDGQPADAPYWLQHKS